MSKTTLRLIIILIVLWGAAYIYKGPMQEQVVEENSPTNFLAEINTNKINEIKITRDGVTTVLQKEGDQFKIAGTKNFFVNTDTATKILEGLDRAKEATLELVSSDNTRKDEFGIGDSAITVTLTEEGVEPVDFVIGKLANNFIDSYISLPQIPDTYSISENLVKLFDKESWHDKVMFKSDASKITKIRLQYPDRQFMIEKSGDEWQVTEPSNFIASGDTIDNVVKTMSDLKAVKIPAQTFDGTGLEKHSLIVQVTGDGIDDTVMIGDAEQTSAGDNSNDPFTQDEGDDNKLYFSKKGSSDNIYLVSQRDRDMLDVTIQELQQ